MKGGHRRRGEDTPSGRVKRATAREGFLVPNSSFGSADFRGLQIKEIVLKADRHSHS